MTIKEAEAIIDSIKTMENWQDEFIKKMDTLDGISGYDSMQFQKMCQVLKTYKINLWAKSEKVKDNTEI